MISESNQLPLWEVFIQTSNGTPHKHAGSVHASDKKMALQNARDIYTRRNEGRSIWVVKSSDMACTTLDEESEFFDTNGDKIYRHATFYVIPEGVKNI